MCINAIPGDLRSSGQEGASRERPKFSMRGFFSALSRQPERENSLVDRAWIIEEKAEIVLELDGEKTGREILALQDELNHRFISEERRKKICHEIAGKFIGFEFDYPEMLKLRNMIDAQENGRSRLFKLVYEDVDVEAGHSILRSINESFLSAQANGQEIKPYYRVYTDVDDTIQPSLNDRAVGIESFYPGVIELYQELSSEANEERRLSVAVLSARPKIAEKLWVQNLEQKFPEGAKITGLFGSTTGIARGAVHYGLTKTVVASIAGQSSAEPSERNRLQRLASEVMDLGQFHTYSKFAEDKRRNLDRDLLLRPEARGIMFGDSGEGDALLVIQKNTEGSLEDPRIPWEYEAKDAKGFQMNAVSNPLPLSFIHRLSSSPAAGFYGASLSAREAELKELNIFMIDNYVDAALVAFEKGALTLEGLRRVVTIVETWFNGEVNGICDELGIGEGSRRRTLFQLDPGRLENIIQNSPPHLSYRLKVLRSMQRTLEMIGSKSREKYSF